MNKFRKITFTLLGAVLLSSGLYSCSNDNENLTDDFSSKQFLSNKTFSDSLMYDFAKEAKKVT